jgi:hypothetical protein
MIDPPSCCGKMVVGAEKLANIVNIFLPFLLHYLAHGRVNKMPSTKPIFRKTSAQMSIVANVTSVMFPP